jgi:hypothetical protein
VRGGKIAAIADKLTGGARPIRLNDLNDGAG